MSYMEIRRDDVQTGAEALARARRVVELRRKNSENNFIKAVNNSIIPVPPPLPSSVDIVCARKFMAAIDLIDPIVLKYAAEHPREIENIIYWQFENWKKAEENPNDSQTISKIIRAVAMVFDEPVHEVVSTRRTVNLIVPRQIIYALCRRLTKFSLPQIGKKIGNRDHSTIIHGVRKMAPLIAAIDAQIGEGASVKKWAELARDLYSTVFAK